MSRAWVVDTCALLEVRRCVMADDGRHVAARKAVFSKLGLLVEARRLFYPKEVWDELKVGNAKLKDPTQDLAFHFADRYKEHAAVSADLTIVQELMADSLVRRVIDPDSEDDIYVLSRTCHKTQRWRGRCSHSGTQGSAEEVLCQHSVWAPGDRMYAHASVPAPRGNLGTVQVTIT